MVLVLGSLNGPALTLVVGQSREQREYVSTLWSLFKFGLFCYVVSFSLPNRAALIKLRVLVSLVLALFAPDFRSCSGPSGVAGSGLVRTLDDANKFRFLIQALKSPFSCVKKMSSHAHLLLASWGPSSFYTLSPLSPSFLFFSTFSTEHEAIPKRLQGCPSLSSAHFQFP